MNRYTLGKIVKFFLHWHYDVRVTGEELLRDDSTHLVLPNHTAYIDPLILFSEEWWLPISPMVDELFMETGKTIERDKNEIYFQSFGETISAYKLSSGEKQMLIILLSVLVQNKRPHVMFMDEPEVSLHIECQHKLVSLIRELNPNVQIILTTHSPAVIMNGWADCVTDVEDIVS